MNPTSSAGPAHHDETEMFFKSKVLGHPSGLFVLFFTEMWERFSYYGMRALLVLFFTASLMDSGWGWPKEHALAIFGSYTALVYLSTMLGGYFADKIIGFRWAVVVGALLMTLGHAAMAIETPFSIYTGLTLLVFGSGFFKPNMTSIVSEMYKTKPEKKDGAYTIFYMGVNSGAFFGIMLCGYLGEKIGWSWGFGVAGIFMLFGLLQFWFAQNIFGNIGLRPKKDQQGSTAAAVEGESKRNPFTTLHYIIIFICIGLGLAWILNDPISKISEGTTNLFSFKAGPLSGSSFIILLALVLFIILLLVRIVKYDKIVRDRMWAITFFAIITMFFWSIFEQSPGSLTLFARDYTQRIMEGTSGTIFKIANSLITIVPLAVITWVLIKLFGQTFKKYSLSNIILAFSFVIIWGIAIWMVTNEYRSSSYNIEYTNVNGDPASYKIVTTKTFANNEQLVVNDIEALSLYHAGAPENKEKQVREFKLYDKDNNFLGEHFAATITGFKDVEKKGAFGATASFADVTFTNGKNESLTRSVRLSKEARTKLKEGEQVGLIVNHDIQYAPESQSQKTATVKSKNTATEIGASWFSILNSLFIITLAPLFSKWWSSKYNPRANMKYAIGMLFLGIGTAWVALGASDIAPGAKAASASIIWLILVYLFHTMAELCVSPVALSYVSKLVPGRMIAVMFGVWYLAVAIGMKLAGIFGEMSESIAREKGFSYFFWMLTAISVGAAVLCVILGPILRKLMHGIR
ncbi:MAG TPA: peptide MFS transporter [Chitinophagaceae bacterium]|nr:peptide MFS transporter [Chitinophagaceae bacterium]